MTDPTRQTKFRVAGVLSTLLLLISIAATSTQVALTVEPANQDFYATWSRTDLPVLRGEAQRTWMWAPEAFTEAFWEEYEESPDGFRAVQYYDKSRMEINDPNQFNDGVWFVTNGLLVVEMIEGQLQIGDAMFTPRAASGTPVAGDPDDMDGPTYAALSGHLGSVADRGAATVTSRIDRDGNVVDDPSLASWGVTLAKYDDVTGHNVAAPFWEFMNSSGTVYQSGQYLVDELFLNEYYATGRPISEPFFADVKVGGTVKPVLLQCFERRCLTYTPDNPPGWQVEAGNVGLHYFCWRYGYLPEGSGACIGSPVEPPDETPPGSPPPPPGAPPAPTQGPPPPPAPGDPDPTATPPGGGPDPTATTPGGPDPTATEDPNETRTPGPGDPTPTPGGPDPTPTSPGGNPTATPTPGEPEPTPTSPSGNNPGVDVLPLNLPDITAGIGQTFTFPVQVRNTGTQTDNVAISFQSIGGINLCPISQNTTRTIGAGETVTVNFSQSCLVALNVVATYQATATISRPPGASDSETDTALVDICLICGGGDPTPTPTPPSGNAPGVDVLPLNIPSISVGVGQQFTIPVQVRNTGSQTDDVVIQLQSSSGLLQSTEGLLDCSLNGSQTRTIGAGQTTTVNFAMSCDAVLDLVASFQATATINRPPGASDSESGTALINICLICGGGPDPTATPPSGNAPGVDVLPLNLPDVDVDVGESFSWPVRVRNTGTQTDTVSISFQSTGGINTCPISQNTTRSINPGQTVTVNFSQSCLLALNVLGSYQATATISRAPGASDSETDTALVTVSLLGGGGGNPTATPTPPGGGGGNAPSVDVLPLNLPDLDVGLIGGQIGWTVQVRNTGTQSDTVGISMSTSGLSLCPINQSTTRTIGAGQTASVTFSRSCAVALNVLATVQVTATIDRAPGASDSESDTALVHVCLLCGGSPVSNGGNTIGFTLLGWTGTVPEGTDIADDGNLAVVPRDRVAVVRARRRKRDQDQSDAA